MKHDRKIAFREREGRRCGLRLLVLLSLAVLIQSSVASAFGQNYPEVEAAVADRLRQQIVTGSVESKRSALSEIRNLRSPSASRLALPALRDREPVVRATAAASVVFLAKNEASAGLIPLLNDKEEFVRREAAFALGDVQDPIATAPLIRLMQSDKILEVRTAAAVALGKIGDSSAIDSLLETLKTRPLVENEFLRRSAARSIGQIAQINVTGDPEVLTPQNFLPEKYKDLGSSDPIGAMAAAYAQAVDVLTSVLRSKAEADDTRREAAYALGAIGDTRSVPVLQSFLSDPDPYLVEISKEALLKIERRKKVVAPTD